ncbi:hypothetical protein GWK47_037125 [Chionoecetes opilio]|uniref:Uncharacterized protein n=1 Tax=Chionoecetes opilio TaxID=41210 RepID=A0A8J5CYT2_CHIOP|nr:hypothetical protein GWK47_037125 [Chionoecetes opilio]
MLLNWRVHREQLSKVLSPTSSADRRGSQRSSERLRTFHEPTRRTLRPAYQPKNWLQGKEENTTIRRTTQDQTLLQPVCLILGQKLFNNLPGKLRNLTECSVEKFKHHLDNHLQTIPDEPPCLDIQYVCEQADTNLNIGPGKPLQHRDAGRMQRWSTTTVREYPQDGKSNKKEADTPLPQLTASQSQNTASLKPSPLKGSLEDRRKSRVITMH